MSKKYGDSLWFSWRNAIFILDILRIRRASLITRIGLLVFNYLNVIQIVSTLSELRLSVKFGLSKVGTKCNSLYRIKKFKLQKYKSVKIHLLCIEASLNSITLVFSLHSRVPNAIASTTPAEDTAIDAVLEPHGHRTEHVRRARGVPAGIGGSANMTITGWSFASIVRLVHVLRPHLQKIMFFK